MDEKKVISEWLRRIPHSIDFPGHEVIVEEPDEQRILVKNKITGEEATYSVTLLRQLSLDEDCLHEDIAEIRDRGDM